MVCRILHQNAGEFTDYIEKISAHYGAPNDLPEVKKETIKAKCAGRWSNGAPLATYPDYAATMKFSEEWDNVSTILFHQHDASNEQKVIAREKFKRTKNQTTGI
jgi:hypothetical protein